MEEIFFLACNLTTKITHINMADWGLVQLLDFLNLLLDCSYYCNQKTWERFISDERGNEKVLGAFLICAVLVGYLGLL